jgi:hypothetical protein
LNLFIRNFAVTRPVTESIYTYWKRDSAMSNLKPTIPLRAAGQMKISELMEMAIPRGEAERIAGLMGYQADFVRRWRRDPEAGEANDSSRRDPVTNVLLFFDSLRGRELGEWVSVFMDYIQSDVASKSKGDGRSDEVSAALVESKLRELSRLQIEIADMLARKGER